MNVIVYFAFSLCWNPHWCLFGFNELCQLWFHDPDPSRWKSPSKWHNFTKWICAPWKSADANSRKPPSTWPLNWSKLIIKDSHFDRKCQISMGILKKNLSFLLNSIQFKSWDNQINIFYIQIFFYNYKNRKEKNWIWLLYRRSYQTHYKPNLLYNYLNRKFWVHFEPLMCFHGSNYDDLCDSYFEWRGKLFA